jgi:dihydropteroate synthase
MEHPNLQALTSKITLNCRGTLLSLEKPLVMGILNLTPDSFFDGGKHLKPEDAVFQAEKMLADGASIIDLGAYSSRPGALHISEEEEKTRLIPVVELLHQKFPEAILSIDTFRSNIAKAAIEAGAHIINDISAGDDDPEMMFMVGKLKVPYIMMHKQGTPQTMQLNPQYTNVVLEVLQYFTHKIAEARKAGITDIIIDPGFGFGKTLEHNYTLLSHLNDFRIFEEPLLVGLSRKGMLQKVTGTTSATALNATTAAHTIALLQGACILRVHDVKEAIECINIVTATYGII